MERHFKSHLKAALLAAFGALMVLGAIYAAFE
jgi:hypothetical protein